MHMFEILYIGEVQQLPTVISKHLMMAISFEAVIHQ
jgi:hypothetical protein